MRKSALKMVQFFSIFFIHSFIRYNMNEMIEEQRWLKYLKQTNRQTKRNILVLWGSVIELVNTVYIGKSQNRIKAFEIGFWRLENVHSCALNWNLKQLSDKIE